MTNIDYYYELLLRIKHSDFKISLYIRQEDQKDLFYEKENNFKLLQELERIKIRLSEKDVEADDIRVGFIHVASGVLKNFNEIKNLGNFYPDLGQGMVISGFLFGKILNDFNIVLKYRSGYPGTEIYMSREAWPFEQLQELIQHIHDELFNKTFTSQLDAIEYYEYIRRSFIDILDNLKKEHII